MTHIPKCNLDAGMDTEIECDLRWSFGTISALRKLNIISVYNTYKYMAATRGLTRARVMVWMKSKPDNLSLFQIPSNLFSRFSVNGLQTYKHTLVF